VLLTGSDLSCGGCRCPSAPSLQWHAAWGLLGMGNMPRGSLRPVACRAGLARKTPSPADGATRICPLPIRPRLRGFLSASDRLDPGPSSSSEVPSLPCWFLRAHYQGPARAPPSPSRPRFARTLAGESSRTRPGLGARADRTPDSGFLEEAPSLPSLQIIALWEVLDVDDTARFARINAAPPPMAPPTIFWPTRKSTTVGATSRCANG
jgi:hypothetical protein